MHDPILNKTFLLNLTNPLTIPTHDEDPVYYPKPLVNLTEAEAKAIVGSASDEILDILSANQSGLSTNCSRCIAALNVAQVAAQFAPNYLPDAMVALCQSTGFTSNSSCEATYEAGSYGASWTQILAQADVNGLDGQLICYKLGSFCSNPPTTPETYKAVFPKPKPANATKPKASGKRVKVLHLSDLHLDPRYQAGSEGNCTSSLCCRYSASTLASGAALSYPAPLYGYYKCDSPYWLALAALQSIGPLIGGTEGDDAAAFAVYTGDLVSHDPQNQLSEGYVEDIEYSIYKMLHTYIGGPVYAALGVRDCI